LPRMRNSLVVKKVMPYSKRCSNGVAFAPADEFG
jgi:hypothetical protein